MDKMKDLRRLVLSVDLLLHVVMNLFGWNNNAKWLLYDFHLFAKTVLALSHFISGKYGLQRKPTKSSSARTAVIPDITYEMLTESGRLVSIDYQLHTMLLTALSHIRDVAMASWI